MHCEEATSRFVDFRRLFGRWSWMFRYKVYKTAKHRTNQKQPKMTLEGKSEHFSPNGYMRPCRKSYQSFTTEASALGRSDMSGNYWKYDEICYSNFDLSSSTLRQGIRVTPLEFFEFKGAPHFCAKSPRHVT